MHQSILNLDYKNNYNICDFIVSECNQFAFNMLHSVISGGINENFFCVFGQEGSGKTHLLYGLATCYDLAYRNANSFIFENSRDWVEKSSNILILDNADKIKDDVWWFHTYNLIKEQNKKLIISSHKPPSMWLVNLADWRSRLATFLCVEMLNPDDDTLKRVLNKIWQDKGINVENNILEYIAKRIDRNFTSIKYWANRIDYISAQNRRPITINMLHQLFSENL